jgi:hypothetical protein
MDFYTFGCQQITVVNEFKVPATSLSLGDINTRYHLPESEVSLNKMFLHKFREHHPNFDELMEN